MITITNIRNVKPNQYDEVWAIVRSLKNKAQHIKHVPELSPSWDLFKQYLRLRDSGQWNAAAFKSIYVPAFLREMQAEQARKKISELVELDRQGKKICLVCFCYDETLCHRSIIAGILQCMGVQVQGVKGDCSEYGRIFFSEKPMERDIHYRTKSLKQLLEGYADEVGRLNQADRETTQNLIMREVYARIKDTFIWLDKEPEAVGQIYKQLIEH